MNRRGAHTKSASHITAEERRAPECFGGKNGNAAAERKKRRRAGKSGEEKGSTSFTPSSLPPPPFKKVIMENKLASVMRVYICASLMKGEKSKNRLTSLLFFFFFFNMSVRFV